MEKGFEFEEWLRCVLIVRIEEDEESAMELL
jgi:hypothetical protein